MELLLLSCTNAGADAKKVAKAEKSLLKLEQILKASAHKLDDKARPDNSNHSNGYV